MDTENQSGVAATTAGTTIPGEKLPNEQVENNTEQTPSIEDRAREQGWRPKEEFDGDASKWVSAETFVAKGELIDRIESLGKKLKESEKTMKMLTEHHAKVKESEFKRAVDFLKAQKKTAYENGDVDKIIELDDQIAEVRETQKAQKFQEQVNDTPEIHPAYKSWVSENKWYENNKEMRADADAFGEAYARNNPDKTPEEVLEYVTKKIKRTYIDEFENPNRKKPSAVEGNGSGGRQQGSSIGSMSLSEEETKVMNTFVRNGVMTKEDYLKELKAMRGAN
jgi:hypothetical protein